MKFTGEFETHITVSLTHKLDEIDRLQQWCIDRQLKFLHILLDPASDSIAACETRSQSMLTRRGYGDFDEQLNIANELSHALVAAGFPVVRIKLEAAPGNQDIPQSDLEAASHPAERYFEHHVNLLLAPTANIIELREVVSQYSAHLSQNVLHVRSDLWQERFVTQRCMRFGRSNAQKQLQILLDSIASLGYNPIDIEAEFVVYDSNWHEHLVLRGSLLLKTWLGDTAREPNDIDWVFRPEDVKREDRFSLALAPTFADLD